MVHLERGGAEDRGIAALVRNDIVVADNARDFLRIHALPEVHPGLVAILPGVDRDDPIGLFDMALEETRREDIVDHVLSAHPDGTIGMISWSAVTLPPKDI